MYYEFGSKVVKDQRTLDMSRFLVVKKVVNAVVNF